MLVLVALLSLSLGVWAVAGLTRLEPEPAAMTIATAPMPESDHQSEWERVETVTDRVPYAVIERGGQLFLFTSMPPSDTSTPTGLELWRSADGVVWESGGSIIRPDSKIDSVGSTALGLFAIGSIGDGEKVRAWLSADGVEWLILMDGLQVDANDAGPSAPREEPSGHEALEAVVSSIGDDASVIELETLSDQSIALVTRAPDPARPYELARFEIWRSGLD